MRRLGKTGTSEIEYSISRKVRNKHEEIIMARREKRRVKRKEKKGNLKL